ncbi:hypothetical protein Tco_1039693, partial [Tanacetum coccineum]
WEVLGKKTGYTIQNVQHNPGPGHPNTFYYSDSDESDDDEPSEMIKVQKLIHYLSGSPTPSSDPVVASLSPFLTPTRDSDFILEETDTLLPHHDSTSPEVDDDNFDPEGDILFLEGLLNDEILSDLPPLELNNDPEGDILFLENEIELNSHEDIDDLIPIPRVSEKPLDSLDCISKTFDMTITGPLFDFDSEFTFTFITFQSLVFHNEDSDESETETIMDEVQIIAIKYRTNPILNPFIEIPSGESKVHIEVLSVLWGNRLPISDGSLLLSRFAADVAAFKKVEGLLVEIRHLDHGRLAYRCGSCLKDWEV